MIREKIEKRSSPAGLFGLGGTSPTAKRLIVVWNIVCAVSAVAFIARYGRGLPGLNLFLSLVIGACLINLLLMAIQSGIDHRKAKR